MGKWRLQNLLKHRVCRDFLNPWSRAWEAKVQAVSQNNYSKIFSPRCLEMSSWGSSDCSGVAPGGHSPTPNDRWVLCTLVGRDVAPEIFYCFFFLILHPNLTPPVGEELCLPGHGRAATGAGWPPMACVTPTDNSAYGMGRETGKLPLVCTLLTIR